MSETEPPSDPDFDPSEDTRAIVNRIRRKLDRAEGAAWVWRALGGLAATVAIGLGTWGLVYAQQAAVDHERVDRLESERTHDRADLDAMRITLERLTTVLERIERDLDRRDP